MFQGARFVRRESAKFEKVYVLDVLDVTNLQKSTMECRSAPTGALETARNPAFQPFRELLGSFPGAPGRPLEISY